MPENQVYECAPCGHVFMLQPATEGQPEVVYSSADGGSTWTENPAPVPRDPGGALRCITCHGHVEVKPSPKPRS